MSKDKAEAPITDRRPAWGFFFDHKIGKIRPLCGKPGPKPDRKS